MFLSKIHYSDIMDDYNLLVKKGNVGIYNSCEITELVIMEPTNKIYNLYTICVFQEKNITPSKHAPKLK